MRGSGLRDAGSSVRGAGAGFVYAHRARFVLYLLLWTGVLFAAGHEALLGGAITAVLLIALGSWSLTGICRYLTFLAAIRVETVLMIFVPSYLVHTHWIGLATLARTRTALETTDAIGVFITVLICGSVVAIERKTLLLGSGRIILPLCVGTILGILVGALTGIALGATATDTFFYSVMPVMAGGINAGALPLSAGYATILGIPETDSLARMVPSIILGNFVAVIFAALIDAYERRVSRRPPVALATGGLDKEDTSEVADRDIAAQPVDIAGLVGGITVLAACYLIGDLTARAFSLPATLITLLLAAILQISNAMPARLRNGILAIYRFCVMALTRPLLFAIGMVLLPWAQLVESFGFANIATTVALVGSLALGGFVSSSWVALPPVDGAIITMTRAAMGGTGDIAILNAGRRMQLMAYAQISTRVGGVVTVAVALASMHYMTA